MEEEKLTTRMLAKRWGMEAGTLVAWRNREPKKGPPYMKLGGQVFYKLSDIVDYERNSMVYPEGKDE
jgi:hypothetical protein